MLFRSTVVSPATARALDPYSEIRDDQAVVQPGVVSDADLQGSSGVPITRKPIRGKQGKRGASASSSRGVVSQDMPASQMASQAADGLSQLESQFSQQSLISQMSQSDALLSQNQFYESQQDYE